MCWHLLMISFYTFWVQTDFTFLAFKNGTSSTLLTSTIFRFTFHNHMIKVSNFVLVPAIPEVLWDCAGRFLPYFPRLSSSSYVKTLTMEYCSHESCEIISKQSPQLHLLSGKRPPTLFGADSHMISWHELVKQIITSHICIIILNRIWHWYVYMLHL